MDRVVPLGGEGLNRHSTTKKLKKWKKYFR